MKKYPKRGEDCEYTMDCMWGVDGWCDRPADRKCAAAELEAERKNEAETADPDNERQR